VPKSGRKRAWRRLIIDIKHFDENAANVYGIIKKDLKDRFDSGYGDYTKERHR
jgi:hypothetical protein